MKSLMGLFIIMCVSVASDVQAASSSFSDAEQLGTMAGLALACGSRKKLEDFELISARILANEAPTEEAEMEQARIYTEAKFSAMQRQQKQKVLSCHEILQHFNELRLFNSIVYKDGSVQLPDGTWSKPLRPLKR